MWWLSSSAPDTGGDVDPRDWSLAVDSLAGDVFDDAGIGVFLLDSGFEVAWSNETVRRYFGLNDEDVVGRDQHGLIKDCIAPVVSDSASFAETVLATCDDGNLTGYAKITPSQPSNAGRHWSSSSNCGCETWSPRWTPPPTRRGPRSRSRSHERAIPDPAGRVPSRDPTHGSDRDGPGTRGPRRRGTRSAVAVQVYERALVPFVEGQVLADEQDMTGRDGLGPLGLPADD